VAADDGHTREERVEVGGDDLLHGHERSRATRVEKPRQQRGDLDSGEAFDATFPIAHRHRQVQRQARDVGEGVGGVHRQLGENRKDLALEEIVEQLALSVIEVVPGDEMDVLLASAGISWLDSRRSMRV
jgi:hypothetical protein